MLRKKTDWKIVELAEVGSHTAAHAGCEWWSYITV